ncbi:ganglioside-induced differentiation-associated protein 1-like [Haliotis rubra]|uniref:ganglioside-induced differentiation-associated protein 1-like n=1 Tax=Haliotis rubra TaxID=36100 RepID=UPI001EE4F09C|nr:ganglioside-induced differentiation-associated protein 1-like [Haliotis rubra]
MEVNPAGQVPVLGDRGKLIPESEDIIEYIDREIANEPKLVPSLDTDLGKHVEKFRKLLKQTPVEVLTHGLMHNPEMAPGGTCSPTHKAERDEYFIQQEAKLTRMAEEEADLKDAYLKKAAGVKARSEVVRDQSRVQAAIDAVHPVLDEVEDQLTRTKQGVEGESWLCGRGFTAADINLVVLLKRLTKLGLFSIYCSINNRKSLWDYWERAQKRLPFIKIIEVERNYLKCLQK